MVSFFRRRGIVASAVVAVGIVSLIGGYALGGGFEATTTSSSQVRELELIGTDPSPHHPAAASETPTATHAPDQGHAANILPKHRATVALEEVTFREAARGDVTENNLSFAENFLAKAREATAKYKDVEVARSDGYFQITQDLPLIGAHFYNPSRAGSMDPAKPAQVLYELDPRGDWQLVGLLYQLPKQAGVETAPNSPLGGLAHWHYHVNLCFTPGSVSIAATRLTAAART